MHRSTARMFALIILCEPVDSAADVPSTQCQAVMDAWCNDATNCEQTSITGEEYFARFDRNKGHAKSSWRCYPASSLSKDRSHYVDPGTSKQGICSRDAELRSVLSSCSGSTFVTTVFRGGTEGCVLYRTPSLLRVQNGSLLAFTQCRQTSHSDKSAQSIHLKHSHDDGLTWGPTMILPFAANEDFSMQHRASTVYDESTGSIFLFDDARKIASSDACEVQIWRTDDLGVSWASALNLTDDAANTTGSALATGIQLPNGKLVICMRSGCNGHPNRPKGDVALWSEDHGLTWTAGERMSDGTNECQLTQLSNGSLLANSRVSSTDRLVSLSNDEGRTWSAARKEPALSGSTVVHSSIFSYGGDLFFSHPEASDRTRLTIRRSQDDGNMWPQTDEDSLLVWAGKSAYSSLGSTADGALAVLWEKDGADLGFAKTFAFSSRAVAADNVHV